MLNIFSPNAPLVRWLQPILAPAYCEHCYQPVSYGQIFCAQCAKLIIPVANLSLKITAKYSAPVLAIANYADPLKKLILAKHGGKRLASWQLAQLIWEQTSLRYQPVDYLVPVPLHWTRLIARGFNQAQIIAESLAVNCTKYNQDKSAQLESALTANQQVANLIEPVQVAPLLTRARRTGYQAELKTVARWQNVQSAFSLNSELVALNCYAGKNLVLVDDLLTTGATVISAAKLLAQLRPKSITIVVACRVV